MTGLAQSEIRGGGPSADEALLKERIRADVYYIENWSLLLDVRIILETLLRTVFIRVAYQRWINEIPRSLNRFQRYVQIDTQK